MITLFHDYTSPASAVAVARAHRLLDEEPELDLELVGFEAIGVDLQLPVTLDVLAELDAVAVAARREGLDLHRPQLLPPTGHAHVVERALPAAQARAWRTTCYSAFWSTGADIGDPAVLHELADAAGLDHDDVRALLTDRGALAAIRRATTARRRDGVGGVPTILAQRTLVPGLLDTDDLRALASL